MTLNTPDTPHELAIDFGGDRFPVSGSRPRLSWKPPRSAAALDEEYELQIHIDGQPEQIALVVGHLLVDWPMRPLRSGEQIRWRARTRAATEASEWSAWHAFEAGLLEADWTASWITPADDPQIAQLAPGTRPARTLHATFSTPGVARARLYATALGVYEAFVNGKRAGTVELAPGSTSYERTLYAQAADVTASIHPGVNSIEIVLSDGWYRGQVGAFRKPAGWGELLAARLELHLDLADGTRQIVRTDEHWTSTFGSITRADLMDGQITDLLAARGPALPVLVDAVTAPPIDWSPAPPVRHIEDLPCRALTRLQSGAWIADFGQNASGWLSLTDLGPAGTRTVIDHGEHLDPATGDLTTTHLDIQRPGDPVTVFVQHDEITSSGAAGETFEPRHTVHGFRYARLERSAAPLDASDLTMRVVHTDLRPTGTFSCGNEDLNHLYDVARWSFRGNAVDVPTDCPTRERIGWTGDYQVFAPTAARLYDIHGFSRKWLRSVRDDQLDDGRIANFSPDGRRIKLHTDARLDSMTGSAGWGDAIVLVPWLLYETYGDRRALGENWDAMVRWVDFALTTARTARHPSRVARSVEPLPHEEYLWDGSFHWGEWCEPKPRTSDGSLLQPAQNWMETDKGEVGTAFLYRSCVTLAAVADVLGRAADSARYARLAQRVKDAWCTEFLDETGRTTVDTQASYVRALSLGLAPDELRDAVAARLAELIREAGTHLGTGFLSSADLLPVLVDTDHADLAYEVLLQRTSPSWLGMLDRGATTIWEEWDGVDENGDAHESLNHYSKGAVIHFLHTHVLGLRQAEGSVAWERFVVAPVPHPSVGWARGTFVSPRGTISVEWRTEGSELHLAVDVPPTATATLIFPDGEELATGPGRFTARRG
ncbi:MULTISPECIES: family 78 glycoside hydrolase catalytic domain [unclassified Streptomyces]|uniref:alpha-L-rhamnosidase n=1 Tax=unclassified Streptomyces TaxID=2593676 RepID=UPI002E81D88B|nr:family 78 glycoside hydrolase catalytic domain [Streptomyces sp. NBC_00569]WSE13483.1 glycoside hydrolase family 78 protein [Streptomyces sp. NBC_01397]WUB97599.1 glycoside hydrolase family 78 protein [Streptomyces sp. NBC_00569]